MLVRVFEIRANLLRQRLIKCRESADKRLGIQLDVVDVLTRPIATVIALVVTAITGRQRGRFINDGAGELPLLKSRRRGEREPRHLSKEADHQRQFRFHAGEL